VSEIILEYIWEKLHTGHWKDVSLVWRKLYGLGELLLAILCLIDNNMADALESLDKGIMMGAPILNDALKKLASAVNSILAARLLEGSTAQSRFEDSRQSAIKVHVSAVGIEIALALCETEGLVCSMDVEDKHPTVGKAEVYTGKLPFNESTSDLRSSNGVSSDVLPGNGVSNDEVLSSHGSENCGDIRRQLRKPIVFKNYQSVCKMKEEEERVEKELETGGKTGHQSAKLTESMSKCQYEIGSGLLQNTIKSKIFERAQQTATQCKVVEHTAMLSYVEKSEDEVLVEKEYECRRGGMMTGSIVAVSTCIRPSLVEFHTLYMKEERPVVLKNCIEHWPAYKGPRKWSLFSLNRRFGPRTVPVELGSRYTDDNWSQKLMKMSDFIKGFIESPQQPSGLNPVGYLAQHPLFEQIPELREDICVPEYCSLSASNPEDDHVRINAWFGPKGTISPLHFDSDHNLFVQVLGSKYIQLYPEGETPYLYPHEGLMNNTSQVDVEDPNLQRFPLFERAHGLQCTLHPGEMLYIPPKCWHYVRSLEVSFSVSFWWK
jgi:hypothetical protein